MSTLTNSVVIVGYVGKDVVLSRTSKGDDMALVSVATHDWYYDTDGNRQEATEWHQVRAFGKPAKSLVGLKAGQLVMIQARLRSRSYKDNFNQTRYITEVILRRCERLTPAPNKAPQPEPAPQLVSDEAKAKLASIKQAMEEHQYGAPTADTDDEADEALSFAKRLVAQKRVYTAQADGLIHFKVEAVLSKAAAKHAQRELGYHPAGYGFYLYHTDIVNGTTTWHCAQSCD